MRRCATASSLAKMDNPAMDQFLNRLKFQDTPESRRRGLAEWKPQDGDVIVATPPKAGTTLVLQIAHCLRSRGDVSFEEINKDCVPCLEMAYDAGVPLDLDQMYAPRLFKTHAWFPHIPGNGNDKVRLVCVIRDPVAIAVSFYHFLGSGWFFSNEDIDIDTFIQRFVVTGRGVPTDHTGNAGIFHIIRSYYEHRNDDRVLLLCYENIVKEKRVHARKIAEFLGVPYDDELLDQVCVLSRYEKLAPCSLISPEFLTRATFSLVRPAKSGCLLRRTPPNSMSIS